MSTRHARAPKADGVEEAEAVRVEEADDVRVEEAEAAGENKEGEDTPGRGSKE
jgi:hypothetical protein